MDSDLTDILRLQAHLRIRSEVPHFDRSGQPCRHPAGLHSQSVGKVLTRMRKLTETIAPEASPDALRTSWPDAMSALEGLLLAMDSHADDLKSILAAATTLSQKALSQVGRQIDGVFEELVGRPINRVKHNGEKFEACYCFNPQFAVYGYFVSGARVDGVIAPSERAHSVSGTHWSFAASVRRLLGQLVEVARIVSPHVRGQLVIPTPAWSEQERSDLRSIAAWLQRCAPFCFPNEVRLRVPDVGLCVDEPYVRLDTLKKFRSVHTQLGVVWSRLYTADGVSRQFAVV